MIKEISNFVEKIDENYFTDGLIPSNGLHILIKIDEEKKKPEKKVFRVYKNKKIIDENFGDCSFPSELLLKEYYSRLISLNKSLDSPAKKIHSSSPFVIWFKKQSKEIIPDLLDIYYKNTKKYFDESNHVLIDKLYDYLSNNFSLIINWALDIFTDVKEDEYIKIYFNIDLDLVKKGYMQYIGSNLFNKADYNLENDEYGGVNSFLVENKKERLLKN